MTINFNRSSINGNRALSDEELRKIAPSIFATGAHESRSERFGFVSTAQVVDALRAEGFAPYNATQGKSRVPGKAEFTKHLIRFRKEGFEGVDRKLGQLFPEVVLQNAHDGTSRYKLFGGMFRLVCLNGMIVADSLFASINISHTLRAVENIIEGSYRVLGESEKLIEAPRRWSGIYLSRDDQRRFGEEAMKLRFGTDEEGASQAPVDALNFLRPKRSEDNRNDLWTIFNIAQENGIRGGIRGSQINANGRRRRFTTRAVNAIDATVDYNRNLWQLAEDTAKQLQAA